MTLSTGDLSGLKNQKQMSPLLLLSPSALTEATIAWFLGLEEFAHQVDSTLCPIMPEMLISGFLALARQ